MTRRQKAAECFLSAARQGAGAPLSLEQLASLGFEPRDISPCVEETVLLNIRRQRFRLLLEALPLSEQRLLYALFFLEMPPRLLAPRLQLSEEDLTERAARILARLRKKAPAFMKDF